MSGVGEAIGGIFGATATRSAARRAARSADYAAQLQLQQYEQARADQAPYRQIGMQALNQLGSLYGFQPFNPNLDVTALPESERAQSPASQAGSWAGGFLPGAPTAGGQAGAPTDLAKPPPLRPSTGPAAGTDPYAAFRASPDYQFRLQEGMNALLASQSARGSTMGGRAQRELLRYGQGMGSQEFGNYYNRLANLAGIGQTATSQLGSLGANAAAGAGQAYQTAGQLRGAGQIGAFNALGQGIQNAFQAYGQNGGFSGGYSAGPSAFNSQGSLGLDYGTPSNFSFNQGQPSFGGGSVFGGG
jgi:hypothetical protein